MFRNDRGAVTVTLLAALPLVLGILISATAIMYVLRTHASIVHKCRTEILEAESDRLETMRELIKLNPQAKRLRAMSATALNPQARAVIRARQLVLATQQRGLLARAKIETEFAFAKLKRGILSKASTDVKVYDGVQNRIVGDFHFEIRPLAVVASPTNSLTPDYQPQDNFAEKEIIRLSWKFWPTRLLPKWFGSLSGTFQNLSIEGQCAATGEKKGNHQWHSRLTVDKRS